MTGRCRFCRCTEVEPCPAGCEWADRGFTLCTACVAIDSAWSTLGRMRPPKMRRAFFRGFVAARAHDDERHNGARNDYARGGASWRYWNYGYAAGEASR
jgi:hypothetical protein